MKKPMPSPKISTYRESPAGFNAQLQGWLQLANGRRKRSLGCAPQDRIGADRAAMLGLPPVPPVTGR